MNQTQAQVIQIAIAHREDEIYRIRMSNPSYAHEVQYNRYQIERLEREIKELREKS